MRKITEVLRLRFELGLGQRQIARSCSIGVGTVHEYLVRARKAGLTWPLPAGWGEEQVQAALFGSGPAPSRKVERVAPDFAGIDEQRRKHKHLTLRLLWEEYLEANPDGYRYSRFCYHYQRWRGVQDVVLRQEYKAGEKLFVDWAGVKIPLHSRTDAEVRQAHLFVAVLGASSYTFAEATLDEQMIHWLGAHIHAFEFFGGTPKLIIPDNAKTGVTRACRYDPDLNPTYQQLALHYGVGVVPARPRKPRDKAKVESGVLVAERWILAALRNRRFFGIEELNQAIRELLVRLNQRPFRKRPGSRASVFESVDKPALAPLPSESFDLSEWSKAKVNIDYHVVFAGNYYSVPYRLVQEAVEIRSTPSVVEIFHNGKRVASHLRSRGVDQTITNPEHRPRSHQEYMDWTPSRIVNWARVIGPNTARMVERLMQDKPHPEMGYRACLGVIRLAKRYSNERLEAATLRALLTGACRYRSIESILKNSLDRQPLEPQDAAETPPGLSPPPLHDNIRGAAYFDRDGSAC